MTASSLAARRCFAVTGGDRDRCGDPCQRAGDAAGGLGARMPKTMLPVAGRPYLEHW